MNATPRGHNAPETVFAGTVAVGSVKRTGHSWGHEYTSGGGAAQPAHTCLRKPDFSGCCRGTTDGEVSGRTRGSPKRSDKEISPTCAAGPMNKMNNARRWCHVLGFSLGPKLRKPSVYGSIARDVQNRHISARKCGFSALRTSRHVGFKTQGCTLRQTSAFDCDESELTLCWLRSCTTFGVRLIQCARIGAKFILIAAD